MKLRAVVAPVVLVFASCVSVAACGSKSSAPPPAADAAAPEDWPMYGRDLQRSYSQPGAAITKDNVASLVQAWTFPVADAVSASPSVVAGVVYVGAWDGFFYALDAATGAVKWK